jgi:transcriptional regulator, tetR family
MNKFLTEDELQRRSKILDVAWILMTQKGIKAVTMDDLTKELSMSKRTLYEIFNDKKEIVRALLLEVSFPAKAKILEGELDALETLLRMMQEGWKAFKAVAPIFFIDMKKYYADLWHEMIMLVQEKHRKFLQQLLKKGIKEHVFRENIDTNATAFILVESSSWIMHYQTVSSSPFSQDLLLGQFHALLIYGIITAEQNQRVSHFLDTEMNITNA